MLFNFLTMHGYKNVVYTATPYGAVERAVASWKAFCELPPDIKQLFDYADEGNLDGAGYELKNKPGATLDHKENFHVTLKALNGPLSTTTSKTEGIQAVGFINDAYSLIEHISPMVAEFAFHLEGMFGLNGIVEEVEASKNNWFVRYLHYFGDRQPGDVIAAPHADKCGFTLHLYESDPGLEYLELKSEGLLVPKERRTWCPMPVFDGQTVIIPSMQLQYKSEGQLKALCHRVIANERTAKTGRYSVVCFVPFLKTPFFNTKGKGRQQDFPSGFNYDMPFSEFSQLFAT